ncbi:hypothetical protein PR048_007628 [Dryococelus australis]|uniref:Uncharacterized protein n=1 Tax=Dryococelus australis TaxID=614101 RepID=A0ABQ9HVM8_9NEOP|nr:hypothetical protein PR048_007628 [Dryococelus australis]
MVITPAVTSLLPVPSRTQALHTLGKSTVATNPQHNWAAPPAELYTTNYHPDWSSKGQLTSATNWFVQICSPPQMPTKPSPLEDPTPVIAHVVAPVPSTNPQLLSIVNSLAVQIPSKATTTVQRKI